MRPQPKNVSMMIYKRKVGDTRRIEKLEQVMDLYEAMITEQAFEDSLAAQAGHPKDVPQVFRGSEWSKCASLPYIILNKIPLFQGRSCEFTSDIYSISIGQAPGDQNIYIHRNSFHRSLQLAERSH